MYTDFLVLFYFDKLVLVQYIYRNNAYTTELPKKKKKNVYPRFRFILLLF